MASMFATCISSENREVVTAALWGVIRSNLGLNNTHYLFIEEQLHDIVELAVTKQVPVENLMAVASGQLLRDARDPGTADRELVAIEFLVDLECLMESQAPAVG
jgi:hypothetical protein